MYQLEIQVNVGRRENCCIKYKQCLVVVAVLVLAEPEEGHCIKYKWTVGHVKNRSHRTTEHGRARKA